MKSALHAGCFSRQPLGQGLDGEFREAWAIGKSVHQTERPHSAHEWVEPELTKTAPMPEVLRTHLVYKFIKQWGDTTKIS